MQFVQVTQFCEKVRNYNGFLSKFHIFFIGQSLNVFDTIWDNTRSDPGSLTLAIFSGSFAFGGWAAMSHMMEELQEPNKYNFSNSFKFEEKAK